MTRYLAVYMIYISLGKFYFSNLSYKVQRYWCLEARSVLTIVAGAGAGLGGSGLLGLLPQKLSLSGLMVIFNVLLGSWNATVEYAAEYDDWKVIKLQLTSLWM